MTTPTQGSDVSRPVAPASRFVLAAALSLTAATACAQTPPRAAEWRVVADVPLPGRAVRFDYQSLDTTTGRLWIAHMGADEVLAFDVRARRVVSRVPDMPGVTGVRVVPDLHRVFAALSAGHAVAMLDSRDGRVLARVAGGRFPDGLAYAPPANKLFVSDEYGQRELVIDIPSATAHRPIPLGGAAGNTQYDSVADRIWVAVQTRNELASIDPRTDSVVERVRLPGIEAPHGLYVDAEHRLIYVAGEKNARVGIVDMREKRIVRVYPVSAEPDVVALDPVRRRLYVAAESGAITAFDVRGISLTPLPRYRAPHAHTVAIDPATGLLYVPLEDVQGRPILRILTLE